MEDAGAGTRLKAFAPRPTARLLDRSAAGIKRPPMGESADILVITDALDDGSRAVSKFLYQCRTGSCLRVVERPEDVAPAISRYDSIQRLVFLLEGGGGHLTVGGVDKELDWYAEQLGGTRTRVKKEIAFDGCDIAKGGARGSPSS